MLALALVVGACGSVGAHTSGTPYPISVQPRFLAIPLTDLPVGWSVDATTTRTITNSRELNGDSSDISAYTKNGWSSAYEADFASAAGEAKRAGILIDVFNDPGGALSFFDAGIGGERNQHGQPLSNPPALGQSSYAFTQQILGPEKSQTQRWLYWIDRNVLVRLLVEGPYGSIPEAMASDLAQRQAAIIRQH